jgi:hypothetical protein
LPSSIGPLKL